MEQIKIFSRGTGNAFDELEAEVNAWLEKHPNIEVFHRDVKTVAGVNILEEVFVNCTIVIFYKSA